MGNNNPKQFKEWNIKFLTKTTCTCRAVNKEKYTDRNGSYFLGDVSFIFIFLLANKRGDMEGGLGKTPGKCCI